MLLSTLPSIQVYQNIIDNIRSTNTNTIYAKVILRLKNYQIEERKRAATCPLLLLLHSCPP